jgi:aerobic carbon-monoxide dehydrogenase medium subunit
MKPAPFTYHAPTTLDNAVAMLGDLGATSEVKLISGGQSLMPMMGLRLAQPEHLVDLAPLAAELSGISQANHLLQLGAMTRQRAAERSSMVSDLCPLLAEALPLWGHFQIRNRGTLGGSLAHADPAAEFPTIALALDAEMTLVGPRGQRTVGASDFFVGFLTTALEPDEVLTRVDLKILPEGTGSSFQEVSRRHGDFAMVGIAVTVTLEAATIVDARIAFSGVSDTPVRASGAEQLLIGQAGDSDVLDSAAERAASDLEPPTDVHASAAYRQHVARALARRALGTAVERARR